MDQVMIEDREQRERLRLKINREMGKTIQTFGMINEGDRILVAVSGGKDSLCLLWMVEAFRKKAPISFDVVAVNLDQGQPGFPEHVLPELFSSWGVTYHIEKQDTYSVVQEKTEVGATYCALCSRLRRGILYSTARKLGCNKMALGHHRDDLIHTLIMNLFYSGKLGTMAPSYEIESGDLRVIRPMATVEEDWIREFVELSGWPIVPCTLCGSQENLKRKETARLVQELETKHPGVRDSIAGAMANIHAEELLDPLFWKDPSVARP